MRGKVQRYSKDDDDDGLHLDNSFLGSIFHGPKEQTQSPTMDTNNPGTTALQFQRLYYEAMDKRRHVIPKFYLDNAVLSWNGHGMVGMGAITEFYNNLAQTTHQINTLDAIPIPSVAVGEQQQAVVVHVSGNVRIKNDSTTVSKVFTQSFILTHQQDKWKVVTDTFRTQNPPGEITL